MRARLHQFAIVLIVTAFVVLIFIWVRVPVSSPPQKPATGVVNSKKAGPPWAYPNPTRTPGFANPEITQANIEDTICNPEWSTRSIRPPASYTSKWKRRQIREWGLPGTPADYEEDHFISLELGGSPTDPRNLWPEPYDPTAGAREKDVVENHLHKQVCSGTITLEEAQKAIVTDWYAVYQQIR